MIAPPWLPVPPNGYGGIENVIHSLVPELIRLGVEVELFAPGDSKLKSVRLNYAYEDSQYKHILRPQYETGPISTGHILHAVNRILEAGNFDIIHDHNNYLGPLVFAHAAEALPPVIHTLHNPGFVKSEAEAEQPEAGVMWRELAKAKNLYFVGLSKAMQRSAPNAIRHLLLKPVYNAVSLRDFPFREKKSNYFITLGSFKPEKGADIAVRACIATGSKLKMAGVVNNLVSRSQVMLELANPSSRYRTYTDFRYFSDSIMPHLYDNNIEYVGNVRGPEKMRFIGKARALLFPIQWEEPFGMAVIEALACGTPVIAMNRGAMPELIIHGKTGFLAKDEAEFKRYMTEVDKLNPADCRESVAEKFSAGTMASKYLERYREAIVLSRASKK